LRRERRRAVSQAAVATPGTRGSQRSNRKLSINVLRATKKVKKRKAAADETSLFRQSNVESGDRVSKALEGIAGRNDKSQLAIAEFMEGIMAKDRASAAD
jgi:hypothetical protein